MNIKLPEGAILFEESSNWETIEQQIREYGERLISFPSSFPCLGWQVSTVYHQEAPNEQVWAFVYPEEQAKGPTYYCLLGQFTFEKISKLFAEGCTHLNWSAFTTTDNLFLWMDTVDYGSMVGNWVVTHPLLEDNRWIVCDKKDMGVVLEILNQ